MRDIGAALDQLAAEVEDLAAKYCTALALGDVRTLDASEMARVIEKFRTYGRQDRARAGFDFGGGAAADRRRLPGTLP